MTAMRRRAKGAPRPKQWWRDRRNRMRVWTALLAIVLIGSIAAFWRSSQGSLSTAGTMTAAAVPVGQKVDSIKLEDSRTGAMFDLGDYLGKRDIVLVAYMGDFCLGCRELVYELERRAGDFEAAQAYLVGLGYETGQVGRNTAQKHGIQSYPLLQEGKPNRFTRGIGMWSDHMDMPWMGYVIIDRAGTIVAGEQMALSEAKGAGPANVDQLLRALAAARVKAAGR